MAKIDHDFARKKMERTGEWTVQEMLRTALAGALESEPSGAIVLLTYDDEDGRSIAHYTSGLDLQDMYWCLDHTALRVLTGQL